MEQNTTAATDKKRGAISLLGRSAEVQLSKHILVDIVAMIDMTMVIGAAFLIRYYQGYYDDSGPFVSAGWVNYFSVTGLVVLTLYGALRWRQHYNYHEFEEWSPGRGGFRLAMTVLFAFGFSLFIVFMLKESTQISRLWVLSFCASSFAILFASRLFWVAQFGRLAARGLFRRRVFLIGTGSALSNARENLLSAQSHVELVGMSDVAGGSEAENAGVLGAAINQAVSKGQSGCVDEVVIALQGADTALLDPIIRRLRILPVDLKVALDLGAHNHKVLELNESDQKPP